MTPTLKQLIAGIAGVKVEGKDGVNILTLATDSRRVSPGALFFALPGLRTDGNLFIDEAIDRGAVAVVCEKDRWVPPHVGLLIVEDVRALVAEVSARFHGHPAGGLELTGLLGTSGKTVVSALLRHFMGKDEPVGLLGTIHYAIGNRTLPAHRTTPEAIELHGLLAQIRDQGCRRALLEVSSHGIDQKRVEGLQFRNLVILNLTPEHLPYHGSIENYVALERGFLHRQMGGLKACIVGLDDPQVRGIYADLPRDFRARTVTFGCRPEADLRAQDITCSNRDTRFTLVWPEGQIKLVSPLLGEFNLQNTLAALACGYAEGLDPVQMGADLLSFPGVRGRMERVDEGQPFNVLIDYMHTEAGYDKGLRMVRSLTRGKLITLFGCGGNRDASIRPVITRLVSENGDVALATTDNPRNETVEAIFKDMHRGNEDCRNLSFIEDRRAAISTALASARPGDTVLIAGKGHETYQEFGDCVVPFDDRAVARDLLKNMDWETP